MPKLKTNKALVKRLRLTKTKKIKIRTGGQDHFNSRERGNTSRNKRRDHDLSSANVRNVKKLLPYS